MSDEGIIDLHKLMFLVVKVEFFAPWAEVVVGTDHAFVPGGLYWEDLADVADYVVVNWLGWEFFLFVYLFVGYLRFSCIVYYLELRILNFFLLDWGIFNLLPLFFIFFPLFSITFLPAFSIALKEILLFDFLSDKHFWYFPFQSQKHLNISLTFHGYLISIFIFVVEVVVP